MISVRNRLQLLSGNKFFLLASLLFFAACSPKVVQKSQGETATLPKEEQKIFVKPFTEANISVLIPFQLNEINLVSPTKAGLAKADMAIDFYQGLVFGIDSAAEQGDLKFNLQVFDTRDSNAQLATVLAKDKVKTSDLIIGPVFPDGQKYITPYAIKNNLHIISPLAASMPSEFKNPQLISTTNDIAQHGINVANFIIKKFDAGNSIVAIINTKSSNDEQLASSIRNQIKANSQLILQEYTSTYALETKLIKGKRYAVVVCSADSKFVTPSLLKLSKLKTLGYDFNVFGHPNWLKQTYNTEQLQRLNTIVPTSYFVDYKSQAVTDFVKRYRTKFSYEPTEYAFKGFDVGYYFGKLFVKHGKQYIDFVTKEKYKGLHNTFNFGYNPLYGYFNKDLFLLQYKNFSLNIVD